MSDISFQSTNPERVDLGGMGLSFLCLLHCATPPLLIALAPSFAFDAEALEFMHPYFLALAVPIALIAFWRGMRMHKKVAPGFIATMGLLALGGALFIEEPHWLETGMTMAACALIIFAHAANIRFCKACPACSEASH